jgi:catechol 2,3-dioxygenase-like lactoylglutathione lyase family enzyme
MRFTIDRIDHIVINCKSVEISAAWYQRVLGMEREDFGVNHRTALKFGGQKINLRGLGRPRRHRRMLHHCRAAE